MDQMNNLQALSDSELHRLSDFLTSQAPDAMRLETLDGYFVALICGPDAVTLSQCLPAVLGLHHVFADPAQASDVLTLLQCHWNAIACSLHRTLDGDEVYLPALLNDEGQIWGASEWAQGFLLGVQRRAESWRGWQESAAARELLLPMTLLAHEHDADERLRSPLVSAEQRWQLIRRMTANLTAIYRYFEPQRVSRVSVTPPLRRLAAKVGRNEPCPCGSGKKFKQCCAGKAEVFQ
jgi:uncharacterized protein